MATGSHQNGGGWRSLDVPRGLGEQRGEQRDLLPLFSQRDQQLRSPFCIPSATPSKFKDLEAKASKSFFFV